MHHIPSRNQLPFVPFLLKSCFSRKSLHCLVFNAGCLLNILHFFHWTMGKKGNFQPRPTCRDPCHIWYSNSPGFDTAAVLRICRGKQVWSQSLLGTKISHLGKMKIIFKGALGKGYLSFQEGIATNSWKKVIFLLYPKHPEEDWYIYLHLPYKSTIHGSVNIHTPITHGCHG